MARPRTRFVVKFEHLWREVASFEEDRDGNVHIFIRAGAEKKGGGYSGWRQAKYTVHPSNHSADGGFLVTSTIKTDPNQDSKRSYNYAGKNGPHCLTTLGIHSSGRLSLPCFDHSPKSNDLIRHVWEQALNPHRLFYIILVSKNKISNSVFSKRQLTVCQEITQKFHIYFLFGFVPTVNTLTSLSMINSTPFIKNEKDLEDARARSDPINLPSLGIKDIVFEIDRLIYEMAKYIRDVELPLHKKEGKNEFSDEFYIASEQNSHFYSGHPNFTNLVNSSRIALRSVQKWPKRWHLPNALRPLKNADFDENSLPFFFIPNLVADLTNGHESAR